MSLLNFGVNCVAKKNKYKSESLGLILVIFSRRIERLYNNQLIKFQLIIVVIITWPEKFDFMLMPEHDVTGILT